MEIVVVPKYSRPHGVALISLGTIMLLFVHVGGLLGIIVVPFGLVLLLAKKRVWWCRSCGAVSDRNH